MKKLNITLIIWTLMMNFAFAKVTYTNELVIELIDNICGDTWCEGDFNFEFHDFHLNRKESKATVAFDLISEYGASPRRMSTSCTIKKIHSIDEVISYYRGRPELGNYFYEELSLCISDREDSFRDILDKK